jgi:hypothetical protein
MPPLRKKLSGAIWVTWRLIAAHFWSMTSDTSTHVVIWSSGVSIRSIWACISAICSGVASSGGAQRLAWPLASIASHMAFRTEAGTACS